MALASWAQWIDRATACGLKSTRLDSSQGHMPVLWARYPMWDVQESANQ